MPRYFVVSLVLLVALALAACGGNGESKPPAGAPSPAEQLNRSAAAVKNAKSFHFDFTQENGTLPMPLNFRLVSAEGDYQAPDRIKAGVKAKASSANVSVDVIGIAERTWITNPFTRRWQGLPDTTVADIADPSAIAGALLAGLKDAKVAGEAQVDGVKTYRVSGRVDSAALRQAFTTVEPGYTVTVDLWLGVDDSLPRRARMNGPLYKDDAANVSRQVELSRFDAPVDIKPPE